MKKRIAAILLSFCMILTLLPTAFAAEGDVAKIGDTTYQTLAEAVAEASDGDTAITIELIGNIEMKTEDIVTIPAGKTIVLDMAKHSITTTSDFAGRPIVNQGNLTITGEGTIDSSMSEEDGLGAVNNQGTLVIENGTYRGATYASGAAIRNTGKDAQLLIEDGTFEKATCAVYNEGTAVINGGTFTGTTCSSCNPEIWSYTIRNVTIDSVMTINDGTFIGTQGAASAAIGKLTVNGGNFKTVDCAQKHGAIFYALYAAGEIGEVECYINGGTFETESTNPGRTAVLIGNDNKGGDGGINAQATAYVTGGTFIAPEGVPALKGAAETGDPIVTGGSFTSDVSAYVPDGYIHQSADGKFTVAANTEPAGAVAAIGTQYFKTLDGAVAAAADDETIVLQDDVAFTGTISLNSGRIVNIDLNGHNVAFTPSEGMSQSGFLIGKTTLNLTGKGIIYETAPNYSPIMVYGATEDVADYSIVNVGKDVTLKGWAPIFINGNVVEDQPRAAYGIKITVEGTLESVEDTSGAAGHGVYINGTNSRTDGNVPVITLTETSNVTSKGNGIYAAGYANWNLAGNITGEDSLSIKSGTFNITGGTYTATGEFADPAEANGNGSENTGSAVSITSNKAYAPKVELNITGGNFISQNGYAFYEGIAQKDGVPAADASYATLTVSGGTFTGNSEKGAAAITTAEKKDVITGGTFSSDVSAYVPGTHDEAMVSATAYTVGQYNDSNVATESGAENAMAARRTLPSGANAYYPTLADAIAVYSSSDTALTLLADNSEALTISAPMTISKNGFTADGLTAGTGISMVESDDSYVFYTTITPAPDTTYSIQYQLEKLDGTGYENDGDLVADVAADAVDATIQEAVKNYTGYSLDSIELSDTTYTVKLNRNVYTVIFESEGETFAQQSLKYGETIVAPEEEPVRSRYTFQGWDGFTEGMTAEGNATFTADWKRSSGGSGIAISKPSSTYEIALEDIENGKVSRSPVRAATGATITLTVTPDEGYILDTLTVTDSDNNEIRLSDEGEGVYTFTMPDSAVTVAATFREDTGENPDNPDNPADELPFADVTEADWFYDAVSYVYEEGLMNGTSNTAFEPNLTTTRGMIVTILYRLEGSPAVSIASGFSDVADSQYYADAVAWAAANQIVTGYDENTFGPDDTITREQMAAILYRYAGYKGYDVTASTDLSAYTDADDISVWAQTAMNWANAQELITGVTSTTLEPAGSATRAQAAAILMRFCETVAK